MHEDIFLAVILHDEPKPLAVVKPFYCTGCHAILFLLLIQTYELYIVVFFQIIANFLAQFVGEEHFVNVEGKAKAAVVIDDKARAAIEDVINRRIGINSMQEQLKDDTRAIAEYLGVKPARLNHIIQLVEKERAVGTIVEEERAMLDIVADLACVPPDDNDDVT